MDDTLDEKSIDPTAHRRQQARAEGRVARSGDFTSAGLLLGALVVLMLTGGALFDFLTGLLVRSLGGNEWTAMIGEHSQPSAAEVAAHWSPLVAALANVLLPPVALIVLLAVALNVVQTGFLFLPHKLAPDWSRVSPAAGFRRLTSSGGGVRLSFGLFKLAVVACVALGCVYQERETIVSLGALDVPRLAAFVWQFCLWTCVKIGGALLALSLLDYAYERWKHERELRMTPQELREETRNLQGDPQVAARRRAAQRELALRGPAAAAVEADLVIVDPGKAAVALRYDRRSMDAPVVIAKGTTTLAMRIGELAQKHRVHVAERHSLAQALLHEVELNRPVPARHFAALAELLAEADQAAPRG